MIKYSIKSLGSKKTISTLFSVAVCIAISISMLAINISFQIEEGFYRADKKYDIIIGPKGNDTQLVMSTLFFSDDPLGTIDEEYLDKITKEYDVSKIVPLAMADSYNGNRIVGTTEALLEGYEFSSGNIFLNDFDMVIGSNIAERYNINIGNTIITSHGTGALAENHDQLPYTVVGILEKTNTAYDNTCFTTIESVWGAHGDHIHEDEPHNGDEETVSSEDEDEHEEGVAHSHEEHEDGEESVHKNSMGYTALLIKTGNISVANNIETSINNDLEVQAINTTRVLRKLIGNIDLSKQVSLLLCGIVILLATVLTGVMSFLMLTNSKKDIELLTFLGMKKQKIYTYVISQVVVLVSLSVTIALLINKFVLSFTNNISSKLGIILDTAKTYPQEVYITLIYIAIIIASAMIYTYVNVNKEDNK